MIFALLTFALTVFMAFFAIMNPISNLTVFLNLTEGADKATKDRINKRAVRTAFLVVFLFMILGEIIFNLFGITLPAFKITGGILVFMVGFDMIGSKRSSAQRLEKVNIDEDLAISPLAIPMLAGPGAIVTAMNFVAQNTWKHSIIVVVVFGIVCYLNYLVFKTSEIIIQKLGHNVIAVIGKLMGLIIAIIGTGMIIEGVKMSFGAWFNMPVE